MKKKAYVIGSRVKESLSPTIFNYWFEKTGIDAEYTYIEINSKNLETEIKKIFNEKNVCGLNVTIPHKENIINYLDGIDIHSKRIGAINCLTKKNNHWFGTNTDWVGFSKSLSEIKKLKKNCAAIIGYGGAAKAIIYSLQRMGYGEIKIFNRTYDKIKNINEFINIKPFRIEELENHSKSIDLIVNTTPTNVLQGFNSLAFKESVVSYDIVYRPKNTNFLKNFPKKNRIFGINMLVLQAAPCFEEWFGEKAIVDSELFKILDEKILL